MLKPQNMPPMHRITPQKQAEPAVRDSEFTLRQQAYREGSELLCDAIEDLVVRTSQRLAIPSEHQSRPLSFARAYLGMAE